MFIFLRILFVITVLSNTTFAMNGKNEEILDSDPTHRNRITISSKEENPSEEINISLNDIFPNELIVEVLSYLNAKELNNSLKVCKKWKDCIEDPSALLIDENKKRAAFLSYTYYKKTQKILMDAHEAKNITQDMAVDLENFSRLTFKYAISGSTQLDKLRPYKNEFFNFFWPTEQPTNRPSPLFSSVVRDFANTVIFAPTCIPVSNELRNLARQVSPILKEKYVEIFETFYPNHFSKFQNLHISRRQPGRLILGIPINCLYLLSKALYSYTIKSFIGKELDDDFVMKNYIFPFATLADHVTNFYLKYVLGESCSCAPDICKEKTEHYL